MTNRVGRRNRKKVPKARVVSKVQFKVPAIVCPFCNNHFEVDKLTGHIGHRKCPFCNKEITSDYYNNRALIILDEKDASQTEKDELRKVINKLECKCNACLKWWKKPLYWVYKLKLERTHKELDPKIKKLSNKISSRKKKLNCLARNSYYVSEWFLSTHFLLETDGKKLINAHYNRDCQFELWCSNEFVEAGGFIGEYKVFNYFLRECLDENSALFGCRLVPNIYVPRSNNRDYGSSFWAQIDLVILTRSCAFVVEVKNWKTDVYVDIDSGDIYTTSCRNSTADTIVLNNVVYCLSRLSLDQNSNHTSWFYENFKGYPFERIYEVTLFLSPKSFESSSNTFVNNRFAGAVGDEYNDVLKVMMDASLNLNNIFTEDNVNDMADRILSKFGDLNQQRARIHKSKVEKLDKMIATKERS